MNLYALVSNSSSYLISQSNRWRSFRIIFMRHTIIPNASIIIKILLLLSKKLLYDIHFVHSYDISNLFYVWQAVNDLNIMKFPFYIEQYGVRNGFPHAIFGAVCMRSPVIAAYWRKIIVRDTRKYLRWQSVPPSNFIIEQSCESGQARERESLMLPYDNESERIPRFN